MSDKPHFDINPLAHWGPKTDKPLLISGPCSAETEEQVMTTARQLADSGVVHVLRGGIWKPRTRPDSFEGVGEIGLKWMQRAKQETGLPIITEVASAAHVELCLKHDFDMLWIGARTTVNPFSVQEIAEALRGVDIPIFVKNPLNPDLQLWIGALERIHRAGVKNLATIHRGFSHYGKSMYRNQPMWEIPIALRTLFPEMPIFCDPSHICGRRDILAQVAQKALDLGMDGLMLESHITPDEAWSDAKQQVTPLRLEELVRSLNVRSANTHNVATDNDLHALRAQIDKIDEDILHLIASRLSVSEEIGRYKKEHQITILQVDRWKEIVQTRTEWANELGLTPDFIERYLEQLHKESIRRQTHVMNDSNNEEPSSTDRTDGTGRLV